MIETTELWDPRMYFVFGMAFVKFLDWFYEQSPVTDHD